MRKKDKYIFERFAEEILRAIQRRALERLIEGKLVPASTELWEVSDNPFIDGRLAAAFERACCQEAGRLARAIVEGLE